MAEKPVVGYCHTCGYTTTDPGEMYCPYGHKVFDFPKPDLPPKPPPPKIEPRYGPNQCQRCGTERGTYQGKPRPACHVCGTPFD